MVASFPNSYASITCCLSATFRFYNHHNRVAPSPDSWSASCQIITALCHACGGLTRPPDRFFSPKMLGESRETKRPTWGCKNAQKISNILGYNWTRNLIAVIAGIFHTSKMACCLSQRWAACGKAVEDAFPAEVRGLCQKKVLPGKWLLNIWEFQTWVCLSHLERISQIIPKR